MSEKRQGRPADALDNRPELLLDRTVDLAWKCFKGLHKARSVGFSATNPLSLPDIRTWLEIYGAEREEMPELIELVQDLDCAWRAWHNEMRSLDDDRKKKQGVNDDGNNARGN